VSLCSCCCARTGTADAQRHLGELSGLVWTANDRRCHACLHHLPPEKRIECPVRFVASEWACVGRLGAHAGGCTTAAAVGLALHTDEVPTACTQFRIQVTVQFDNTLSRVQVSRFGSCRAYLLPKQELQTPHGPDGQAADAYCQHVMPCHSKHLLHYRSTYKAGTRI
jgi:hypothetical protein